MFLPAGAGIRIVSAGEIDRAAGGKRKRATLGNHLTAKAVRGIAHLRQSGTQRLFSRYGNAREIGGVVRSGEMLDMAWARLESFDPVVVADRATQYGSDLLTGRIELDVIGFDVWYEDLDDPQLVTRIGNYRDAMAVASWMLAEARRGMTSAAAASSD